MNKFNKLLRINLKKAEIHRKDIDGLRAIAVLSVIGFHFGLLPNGYLGVDVFFVISGFLITNIIYNESLNGEFFVKKFYIRRIRRIIPLVLFISIFAIILGIFVMLPDPLENLAQSIIATNLFSNNILQAITTRNYWDTVNEFKPMLHTWSLGIEEQYYLLYPIIFMIFNKKRIRWILPILAFLTIVSFILYLMPYTQYEKFYFLPFRFFELSFGGIAAILLKKRLIHFKYSFIVIILLLLLLIFNDTIISSSFKLVLVVLLSCIIIVSTNSDSISSFILKNPIFEWIGLISFSLYMWHQLILSFTRYYFIHEFSIYHFLILLGVIVGLSTFSYYYIEKPFRDKHKVGTKKLIIIIIPIFLLIMIPSFFIYYKSGVLKDVPELDIYRCNTNRKVHKEYNQEIFLYNNDFETTTKIKVLIYGDSFGRDWANVLLESKYNEIIEISYTDNEKEMLSRFEDADIVFLSFSKQGYENRSYLFDRFDVYKVWCVGIKNYGIDNGIFYNYRGDNYCYQKTKLEKGYYESNEILKKQWGNKYINLIDYVIDEDKNISIFTPKCKFISADCRHFTKSGAIFYANLIERDNHFILNNLNDLLHDKNIE